MVVVFQGVEEYLLLDHQQNWFGVVLEEVFVEEELALVEVEQQVEVETV